MIQKIISVICDFCQAGIDHYPEYTKRSALKETRKQGTIFYKGKHFCNDKCKDSYIKESSDETQG